MRFYLPVGRQHVHQGISAQHDILLIQPAQGCRLADKIISIYDDMNGHFMSQQLIAIVNKKSVHLLRSFSTAQKKCLKFKLPKMPKVMVSLRSIFYYKNDRIPQF
jgi:hypothetical protein